MTVYEALRLQAMLAVVKPDEGALMRRVRRWYSKTLNTPLAEVEKLDPHMVLREYWEDHYEAMEDDRRDQELEELLETPEQALERDRQWQKEEVDNIRIRKKIEAQEAKAATDKTQAPQTVMKFVQPMKGKDTSLSKLPEVKNEDSVKISFVSADDLEAELSGDALNRK